MNWTLWNSWMPLCYATLTECRCMQVMQIEMEVKNNGLRSLITDKHWVRIPYHWKVRIPCPLSLTGSRLYSKGGPKFPPTLCGKWQSACQTNGARRLPSVHTFTRVQLCALVHAFISCQASVPRVHTLAEVTPVAGRPKPTTYTTTNVHIQSF